MPASSHPGQTADPLQGGKVVFRTAGDPKA